MMESDFSVLTLNTAPNCVVYGSDMGYEKNCEKS